MAILDAHLHLWDPRVLDYAWLAGDLDRPFAIDEVRTATAGVEDVSFLFMQADARPDQAVAEIDWVLSLTLPVVGAIGFAPMEDPAALDTTLAAYAERPAVVGVRRLLQSEAPGFARTPEFLAGARRVADAGLVFDACVRGSEQLADVAALAAAVPDLRIVLDHLGKPAVGSTSAPASPTDGTWRDDLATLATYDNVTVKLSGLPGESTGRWNADLLTPFLDAALDLFGPDRLLYASDWPASFAGDTTDGYRRWLDTVLAWIAARDLDADAILGSTAARVYGVD